MGIIQCTRIAQYIRPDITACRRNDDGLMMLEMTADEKGGWSAMEGKFCYSEDYGLELEPSTPG
ncbi:MAG: hypothetical protein Q7J38_01095 [Gallionella sp.]|nr:hypothetical protein [Gallionella sp.]